MNRTKVVFSLLLPLLLALCLYRLASTAAPVSALSIGTPASTAGALASHGVCLGEPRFAQRPPAGHSGAPREATCHYCHRSYRINDPSGGVTIDGLPNTYVAGGNPIDFTVTLSQDGTHGVNCEHGANIDWGFQLTVLDANYFFVGTLMATDETNTQVIDDGPDGQVDGSIRYYIEQTMAGTFYNPQGAPSATWSMRWVPPDADVGPVTFYVAGNAGTGDFVPSCTYVFLNNQTVSGPGANFVANAHSLSGVLQGPKAVLPLRSAPPFSRRAGTVSGPRRNGRGPVLVPVSAHHTRS